MWYVIGGVVVVLLIIGTLWGMKDISAIRATSLRAQSMRRFAFLWPVSVLVWPILRRRVLQETDSRD